MDKASDGFDQQPLIAKYIQRFGSSMSIAVMDPAAKIFHIPMVEGILGYRIESKCAIVFGEPMCAPEDLSTLTRAFHQYCDRQDLTVTYVAVSEKFALWAMKNVCQAQMQIAEELVIDPHCNLRKGSAAHNLRNKINQALNVNVHVSEYQHPNEKLEKELSKAALRWLHARKGPQIYLTHVNLFQERTGKRWFYAKQADRIVGVLVLNRLDARRGWLVNLLLATPDAPIGTSELLVISTIDTLNSEGCRFLTVGVTQSKQIGTIIGLGKISSWIVCTTFKLSKKIFRMNTHGRYWKKFQPKKEPSFLLFSNPNIGLSKIFGLMKALNVSFK